MWSGRVTRRGARVYPPPAMPSSDPPSDAALLARLAAGEPGALDALLSRYWAPLVTFVTRLTGAREAAEDVVQETFYRLWERRRQWREAGSVRGLLFRLARNIAISRHRHLRAEERVVAALAGASPDRYEDAGVIGDAELREALERAIAALSPRRREVFLLRVVHGMSYKEIASILGTSTQTIANQLSHALAQLREHLRDRRLGD